MLPSLLSPPVLSHATDGSDRKGKGREEGRIEALWVSASMRSVRRLGYTRERRAGQVRTPSRWDQLRVPAEIGWRRSLQRTAVAFREARSPGLGCCPARQYRDFRGHPRSGLLESQPVRDVAHASPRSRGRLPLPCNGTRGWCPP